MIPALRHFAGLFIVLFTAGPALLAAGEPPAGACGAPANALPSKLRAIPTWFVPVCPVHVAGPVYFVGTKGLGVWLIKTRDGDILLNTGYRGSGRLIERSLKKLFGRGYRLTNIKQLLASHAHVDHVGALAWIQRRSGAPVAMMAEDMPALQTGGKADFSPLTRALRFRAVPVVARALHDRETVVLGGVTLTALRTGGHTPGATTFVLHTREAGRPLTIVFPDGTGINPGTHFQPPPRGFPCILQNYERTLAVLEDLHPDIWLTPHLEVCGFAKKRERAEAALTPRARLAAWIDKRGYTDFLANERKQLDLHLQREGLASRKTTLALQRPVPRPPQ
jgi:metallo-beta-lactamase class B